MILVTGAGGTVGAALIEALRAGGHRVRAAYRSPHKAAQATREGRHAVALDFARPATLPAAFDNVESVFLLGTGVQEQSAGEINLVDAAIAARVERLVKLSVFGAVEEQFELARMHRVVERAIERSRLAWTFLRPNSFMQNFVNHMGETLLAQNTICEPAADARIAHIDVRDIASVAARVLTTSGHERKAYTLSGPQALSYGEAAEVLSRVLGRTIGYVALTDEAARAGMLAAGMPDFTIDALLDLNRYFKSGAASQTVSDASALLGRAPITFEQFVRDHAHALG